MAAIPGLVEHVETEFGESILARDAAIARARREGCVGPPDLVWLQARINWRSSARVDAGEHDLSTGVAAGVG